MRVLYSHDKLYFPTLVRKRHTLTHVRHSQPESIGQNLDSAGLQWSLVKNKTWSLIRD